MCGLVGLMAKTMTEDYKKAFNDMLYLDVLRGDDSTGVAAISNAYTDKMEIELFKSIGSASDLFYQHSVSKRYKTLTHKPVNIYIGHNRFATQGKIDEESAHPFQFENVVGAHNGTVSQYSMKSFKGYKDFNIDSQIIYSQLSETRDIKDVWKHADGAMALSWFDKQSRLLNLIRNKERPLFFVYSEDDKVLMWASESWMLYIAAGRHGIKLNSIVEVKPDTLYTFDIGEDGKVVHKENSISPFVPKPVVHQNWLPNQNYHYGSNYYDDWDEYGKQNDFTGYTGPKAVKEKEYKNCAVIVTEFHDIPSNPSAVGVTQDGQVVKINIPIMKYNEAKTRVQLKGEQWYFTVPKIFKSAISPGLWCNWPDCRVIKLKPHMSILRLSSKGFIFQSKTNNTQFAPWYDTHLFLTQSSYKDKTACGCFNCKNVPSWNVRSEMYWVDAEIFFCPECKDLPIVKDLLNFKVA